MTRPADGPLRPSVRDGSTEDELAESLVEMRAQLHALGEHIGPRAEPSRGTVVHLRRYLPFYALASVWLLLLVLVPATNDRAAIEATTKSAPGQLTTTDPGDGVATGALATGDARADASSSVPGGTGSAGLRSGTSRNADAVRAVTPTGVSPTFASGVTRGGFECKPGVPQLPWSDYAGPCVAKFTGDNGGVTFRGVTKDRILISRRSFDQASQWAPIASAAGVASEDVVREVRDTFIGYFNKIFELYGRQVEFVDFTASAQSSDVEEAQSRGKEGACIDATKVEQEIKAFAEAASGWGPYGECLAERKVVHFGAGPYFPETWYRRYHPYLYNGIMECERIAWQVSEYMGKRMNARKAKWAGDPAMQTQNRVFGQYVPNNDEYQHCVNIFEKDFAARYGGKVTSRYNYTLDVSRFPDEAARGVVQFRAAGVTTIINSCDPYSTLFMTQAANGQNYKPEWYIIGVAAQDVDTVARLFDQGQVDGHLFGLSQLGDQSKLWGPSSEPGVTFKKITGKDIPPGTDGSYFYLLQIFSFLQSAGPFLTPENMDKGVHALPPMGTKTFAVGYFTYADGPDGSVGAGDHSGIDDSREIYWCGTCPSRLDGKAGTYLETLGGKRFRNHEWAFEEAPVYPAGYRQANGG